MIRFREMGDQLLKGGDVGREWIFYDVAGSQSLVSSHIYVFVPSSDNRRKRGVWHPYFMDVKAIIFLAPISVFDEKLEEDTRISQLEVSVNLWTAVCKSKLLSKVNFHHAFSCLSFSHCCH